MIGHTSKNWERYDKKKSRGLSRVQFCASHVLMRLEFYRKILEKYSSLKFHENPPIGSPSFSTQTDGKTNMVKLILDNDQIDTHLLYFTIRLLQSSTCFEHYMFIIRSLNCIDAASCIVTLSKWPSDAYVERETPDDEHIMLETCRGL